MARIGTLLATGLALLFLSGASLRADDTAPSAEATLKAKGLTRVGAFYLLDADVNLRAGLKAMRQARAQLDSAVARRSEIEAQLRGANDAIGALNGQLLDIDRRMEKVKDVPVRFNELVGQQHAAVARLQQAQTYVDERRKALARIAVPNDEYVSAVVEESDRVEAAQREYDTLAADPAVAAALAQVNKTAKPPVRLGPSEAFKQELPSVRRERWKIKAAGIKLSFDLGVPTVSASLNGKANIRMVVDSGAGDVFLSAQAAHDAGLDDEPAIATVHGVSADGKVTEAQVKIIKTLRVGQFVVENVACSVAKKGEGDMSLLGGTFLHHFVYRMDLEAGELYLSAIGATPEKPDASASAGPPLSSSGSGAPKPLAQSPAVPKPGATTRPTGPAVPAGSGKLVARFLYLCADDFVVEIYVNGRRVEDDRRKLVEERYGATAERIDVELHAGDWVVFNVVNDRLRWKGSKYFAAAAMADEGQPVFWTEASSGTWTACDAPANVEEFIARPTGPAGARAEAISDHKWGLGDGIIKRFTQEWPGEAIWAPGSARSVWIKCVVPEPKPGASPAAAAGATSSNRPKIFGDP